MPRPREIRETGLRLVEPDADPSDAAADSGSDNEVIGLVDSCLNLVQDSQDVTPPKELRLSVVVPVYNEQRWLRTILNQIRAVRIPKQIILVDDCSRDGTRDIVRQVEREALADPDPWNELLVIYHQHNQGKGAALRTGFAQVDGDVVIVQDADLEYSPSDYPALIAPIARDDADVVYGSRYLGTSRRVLNFWHTQVNRVLTTLSNMFTGLNLTDMETCYKVFKADFIREIAPKLRSDRFGFEPEVTAFVARQKLRVYEVPIRYAPRGYAEGKKIRWWDGVQAIACIVRSHFAR
jgi:glycosyltransferase involved in cell wall biosynthesis